MKKYRIRERVFATALVICMILTMVPANINADDHVRGDVEYGDLGISDINYEDKIVWPIEIYDYANDGMLFEYASYTGDGNSWAQLDKTGEYCYMPDMTTTYYADYTTNRIPYSYVVTDWFPAWGHTNSQVTDMSQALKYYTFDATLSTKGGTELIDFRDKDSDGIEDCLGGIADESGDYTFNNVAGYKFTIGSTNGSIAGEDATIVTSASAYSTCNPNWAVSVQLRPTGNTNEYKVVKVVSNPGSAANAGLTWETGDIVMVVHSAGASHGYTNWKNKVAALSLQENTLVTVASDYSTVTVATDSTTTPQSAVAVSKDDVKYAVLVYKTSDLEANGTLEAMLRDASGEKYFGSWATVAATGTDVTSEWTYAVLDFTYFTKASESEAITYSAANWWDSEVSNDIISAGIRFIPDHQTTDNTKTDSDDYSFMISHFAMFSTAGEATAYGEKALINNKHNIHTVYPKAEYSADYTTSEIAITKIESYWFDVLGITKVDVGSEGTYTCTQATDTNGRLYYNFDMFPGREAELIDLSSTDGVAKDKVRYAVLVYRVEGLTDGESASLSAYARSKSQGTTYGAKNYSDAVSVGNSSTWVYQVFDFSTGSDGEYTYADNIFTAGINFTLPSDTTTTDYDFKVSHFALFGSEAEATAYGKQALVYNQYSGVPASYYNPIYNNHGFGLTDKSQDSMYDKYNYRLGYNFEPQPVWNSETNAYDTYQAETTYASISDKIYYLAYGRDNSEDVGGSSSQFEYDGSNMKTLPFDGYTLYGTITEGSLTAGLLSGTLGADGNPVYRDISVGYVAELLKSTLEIPEYENGYFNYDFIRGEARIEYGDNRGESIDLATAIRRRVGIDFATNDKTAELGDLASTNAKAASLKGTWAECKEYVTTCYDAAYFLLNNLFVAGSYNEPQNTYNYMVLNRGVTSEGKEVYFFDAGVSNGGKSSLVYDTENKTIGYTDATGKALYYTTATTTTTLFPFLPVTEDNNESGMTKSPYFADPGVSYDGTYGETYWERDFNYVMKSSGEFVYHEEDGLFFDFEGDDDVYLFINGQLVLDIGGAHSITKQKISVNDYVYAAREAVAAGNATDRDYALDLAEGEVCTFDFFYMERHGYGANCRIATNLRVTDPAVKVDKSAYQNGEEVNYGGVVEAGTRIEYKFAMTNTGNTKLYNIVFEDPFIGVSIDPTNGLTAPNTTDMVTAEDGSTLDVKDITAIVTGYKKVTDGTGNYINENGTMVQVAVGEGEYIATRNEITFDSNEELKAFMATLEDGAGGLEGDGSDVTTEQTGAGSGLWINSTLTIEGIYYKLTTDQKESGHFSNTVYVTGTTLADTTQSNCEILKSSDTHRVYVPSQPYYYQWAGHDIVITKSKLVDDIINAKDTNGTLIYDSSDLKAETVNSIALVSSNGQPITLSQVTIDTDYNVTVNYADKGTHVFYLKITYYDSTKTMTVPVVINTTDVKDSYIVLDYGLTVDLTAENGIFSDENITIPDKMEDPEVLAIAGKTDSNGMAYAPSYTALAGDHRISFNADADGVIAGTDGEFAVKNNGLTYKPTAFMDEIDTIWAAVRLYESGYTTPADLGAAINISKEVQMYQSISVLPANVVYYEDNFPAIKYPNVTGNTFTQVGDNSSLTQSPDQNQEYGQDDAYASNSDVSGNSITKITIGASGQVAYFDFTGTGFELISRTNATDSAKLAVKVSKVLDYDTDGSAVLETDTDGEIIYKKNIPVITEFDHGANGGDEVIYQVPVIRVNELTYGTYRVFIQGVPARDYDNLVANGAPTIIDTTLYIDGLRIYQPLAESTDDAVTAGKNEHYIDAENGAIFQEIRNLILDEKAAVAKYNLDSTTVFYGTITWTENRNNETYDGTRWTVNQVNSANDYLALGPNNEVYMDSEDGTAALVFYVNEEGTGAHDLQIALRAIDRGLFYGTGSTETKATIVYGVEAVNEEGVTESQWKELATANSATEQYYSINYLECPYIDGKGFQVAIKVTSGMVSYSSIKYNGLVLGEMPDEVEAPTLEYENGILSSITNMLASDIPYVEEDIDKIDEDILYQIKDNSDVRLIAFVDGLREYSKVSFTLTIDGKESKELVCTTAYAGLYAAGNLYTAKDIYGEDGYFVAYTINKYVDLFAGQEVTITATYTSTTGEIFTDARTVTIGAEK